MISQCKKVEKNYFSEVWVGTPSTSMLTSSYPASYVQYVPEAVKIVTASKMTK